MRNNIFLSHYKFLKEIPIILLNEIDLNCLDLPNENQQHEIDLLENLINSNIVIYRKRFKESGINLCNVIISSELNIYEQKLLKEFEYSNLISDTQIAVAYKKSIKINYL